MEQYIKKSTLIAEIERLNPPFYPTLAEKMSYQDATKDCIDIIYTLKVEEVDINKEIDNYLLTYWNEEREKFLHPFLKKMCVHFFELGITASNKIQKGK